MTRRWFAALLLVAALGSCSRRPAAQPNPNDPRRIVSVSPAMTEALFAVGAGELVVGRSRFCDWPPQVATLPAVGGVVDVDLERILELRPDLVVGAPGPPSAGRLTEWLGARGIGTWFPEVDSFASIDAMIRELGVRTRHPDEAQRVLSEVDALAASIERQAAGDRAPRVLLVFDVSPPVVAGPKSFADEMIRRAHGVNVVTDGAPWQAVGFERIVDLDPELILDASMGEARSTSAINVRTAGWAEVAAVRDGHVVTVTDVRVLRPGPRIAEGLAILAHDMHPKVAFRMAPR